MLFRSISDPATIAIADPTFVKAITAGDNPNVVLNSVVVGETITYAFTLTLPFAPPGHDGAAGADLGEDVAHRPQLGVAIRGEGLVRRARAASAATDEPELELVTAPGGRAQNYRSGQRCGSAGGKELPASGNGCVSGNGGGLHERRLRTVTDPGKPSRQSVCPGIMQLGTADIMTPGADATAGNGGGSCSQINEPWGGKSVQPRAWFATNRAPIPMRILIATVTAGAGSTSKIGQVIEFTATFAQAVTVKIGRAHV